VATTASVRTTRFDDDANRANRSRLARRHEADVLREQLGRTGRMIGLFPCECRRTDCVLTVPLTAHEYDSIRPRSIEARAHRAV
jgi:hypothetical protein